MTISYIKTNVGIYMKKCIRLKDFLDYEVSLIEKHIDKHKWFNHIEDKDEAIADFINKYAWIIKESYCINCTKNSECGMISGMNMEYSI